MKFTPIHISRIFVVTLLSSVICCSLVHTSTNLSAAELPLVRIAHGAFSEKIAAMRIGAEQGLFRKHGVNVEVINIRSGPQTMAALVSGDIQVAYTIPGSVVSAAASGLDVRFLPASSTKPTVISSPRRPFAMPKICEANASGSKVLAAASGRWPCSPSSILAWNRRGTK